MEVQGKKILFEQLKVTGFNDPMKLEHHKLDMEDEDEDEDEDEEGKEKLIEQLKVTGNDPMNRKLMIGDDLMKLEPMPRLYRPSKHHEQRPHGQQKQRLDAIYTFAPATASRVAAPVPSDRPLLEEDWYGAEFLLIDNILAHELPDSPNSPKLISLQLRKNQDLMTIPSSFFHQMPLLQILDLSYTGIKSLPESISRLVSLKELILRGCELMMELSPLVGQLHNLEKLDLDQTKILELPETVGNLSELEFLRFSLFKYEKQLIKEEELQHKPIIHTEILSNLLKLTVLSIDVDPDDERWDEAAITMILMQVFKLTSLTYLSLYLPNTKMVILAILFRYPSRFYHQLAGFRFTVGHHKDRLISRVPREVEALFGNLEKCFRLINGTHYFHDLLTTVTSFFLDSHVSATSLSDFFPFVGNSDKLKFCILTECHNMQTIIDVNRMGFFPDLEYLLVYYAKNLKTIWTGPGPATNIYGRSLSNLRILALHMCPKLSVIFTPDLAQSMHSLEELVIEDCPEITSIFISGNNQGSPSQKQRCRLPTLRRISLLFLPKLETISNVLLMAPMLGKVAIYCCRQLRNLSTIQTQVKPLVIKGEATWWNGLEWENQKVPSHVQFSEIEKKRDLITQLVDDKFMVLEYQMKI